MRQAGQRRGERAHQFQFPDQVADRQRQFRRGQHLLADRHQGLLGGDARGHALGEGAEQVDLLDVFLALEHEGAPAGEGKSGRGGCGRSAAAACIL